MTGGGGNHRQGEGVTIDRGRGVTINVGRGIKGNKWFTYLCRPAVQHKSQMKKLMSDVYYMFALNKGKNCHSVQYDLL